MDTPRPSRVTGTREGLTAFVETFDRSGLVITSVTFDIADTLAYPEKVAARLAKEFFAHRSRIPESWPKLLETSTYHVDADSLGANRRRTVFETRGPGGP